jgi:hypothetical protein
LFRASLKQKGRLVTFKSGISVVSFLRADFDIQRITWNDIKNLQQLRESDLAETVIPASIEVLGEKCFFLVQITFLGYI